LRARRVGRSTLDRTGPDGETTHVVTDARGLVTSVQRGSMEADYEYWPDGRKKKVTYGSGATVEYAYDAARRLTGITHSRVCGSATTVETLAYEYTADGLIDKITEEDATADCTASASESVVTFTYDTRNRLIEEARTGDNAYDIGYVYDQGGNRVQKTVGGDTVVDYIYDVSTNGYGSHANRLMRAVTTTSSSQVMDVRYHYDGFGHVDRIERHDPSGNDYSATNLYYNTGGRLWLALDQTWQVSAEEVVNCVRTKCREFRYDGGRARYLYRERDPESPFAPIATGAVWTDYDGDGVYEDNTFDANSNSFAPVRGYLPGVGQKSASTNGATEYFHGDQIGSTRVLTNASGAVVGKVVYTAFGEPIASNFSSGVWTRYQYGGAFGYENMGDAAFPYLHVGARWYDPASGRFLQRDRIGMRGGYNCYVYGGRRVTFGVDPDGLDFWSDAGANIGAGAKAGGVIGGHIGGIGGLIGGGGLAGAGIGAVAGGTAGAIFGSMCGFWYTVSEYIAPYIVDPLVDPPTRLPPPSRPSAPPPPDDPYAEGSGAGHPAAVRLTP
jgi:RHS repeat-associated protein